MVETYSYLLPRTLCWGKIDTKSPEHVLWRTTSKCLKHNAQK